MVTILHFDLVLLYIIAVSWLPIAQNGVWGILYSVQINKTVKLEYFSKLNSMLHRGSKNKNKMLMFQTISLIHKEH